MPVSSFISLCLFLLMNTHIITCSSNKNKDSISYLNLNDTTLNLDENSGIYRIECEGKLFTRREVYFPETDIRILCNSLIIHKNFLIRLNKSQQISSADPSSLFSSTKNFFDKICIDFAEMCNEGVLIDLYTEENKIILHLAEKSNKLISEIYKARVIETIKHNLLNNYLGKALEEIMRLIEHKLQLGHSLLNQRQSDEPIIFIWDVLIPILLTIFLLLFVFINLLSKGYINSGLFFFMNRILDLWQEINDSAEKRTILSPNTCLFCMKNGNNTYKFLYCNHSYHYRCFYSWQLNFEKCCPCSYTAFEGEESGKINYTKPAYLNCEDVMIILGRVLDAHRKQNVYDYFIENEQKIKIINEKYNVSFEEMCWIHSNKIGFYKNYRVFHHIWTTLKMMFCLLTFDPSDLVSSKKKKNSRKYSHSSTE